MTVIHRMVTTALCTTVLTAAAAGTARASCGIPDIAAAATAASSGRLTAAPLQAPVPDALAPDSSIVASIVGLWHTTFSVDVGGTEVPIQEAFQLWNVGGTEVHNPKVDPRQGNVCLGVWQQTAPRTFTLTHRVWAWDTNGGFGGTLHLSETLRVARNGQTFSGTFAIDIYDPSGALVGQVAGRATGERISVGDQ